MMDELMEQFVVEAKELAQVAVDDLLALERDPSAKGRLESLFRAVHTLKGSVGLFDFGPMHDVLHMAEEMLSSARAGSSDIDADFIDPLLGVIEWTERCVTNIEKEGGLSKSLADGARQLLAGLQRVSASEGPSPHVLTDNLEPWATALFDRLPADDSEAEPLTAFRYVPHSQSFFNGDDPLAFVSQINGLLFLSILPREPWPNAENFDPYKCNLVLEGVARASEMELVSIFRLIPDQVTFVEKVRPGMEAASETVGKAAPAMRVDPARIDRLVAIAGELVTAKNGLLPLAADARQAMGDDLLSRRILESQKEIERLVGELYAAVTKARLVALDQTFRRFPRLVRETASRLGKSVELVIEGADLEADREIVENLFEPLLHLVRNSLDHGIETEAERASSGKPVTGRLSLLASHKGDGIELVLSDDGRGLDPTAIKNVAIAKGALSSAQADAMSDNDAIRLVFAAGFSTASEVTDLSGRGVGLDAVRDAIHRLGGELDLSNAKGHGATFTMSIPISLAMSRLIVVKIAGERFGIPIGTVAESVRLRALEVLPIRSGEAFVLRNQTLPLVRLGTLLGLAPSDIGSDIRVLVCNVDGHRVGVAVDEIAERTETLTRPLSPMLKSIVGVSGTALTGDGRILLVLDLEALVR